MPTTSSGDTVYADPAAVEQYVQTAADQFGLSTTGSQSEWRQFLEDRQVEAKARIDEYTGRDFEDHPGDTVVRDGGAEPTRFLDLPAPVRSITEVRVDGEALATDEYLLRDGGQLIRVDPDAASGSSWLEEVLSGASAPDEHWPAGYGNVEIDLDWGYQTPPADVAEAEKKLVGHTISGLIQMREGMIVQQDDVDVTVRLPSAMTAEVRAMLATHRDHGRTVGLL